MQNVILLCQWKPITLQKIRRNKLSGPIECCLDQMPIILPPAHRSAGNESTRDISKSVLRKCNAPIEGEDCTFKKKNSAKCSNSIYKPQHALRRRQGYG